MWQQTDASGASNLATWRLIKNSAWANYGQVSLWNITLHSKYIFWNIGTLCMPTDWVLGIVQNINRAKGFLMLNKYTWTIWTNHTSGLKAEWFNYYSISYGWTLPGKVPLNWKLSIIKISVEFQLDCYPPYKMILYLIMIHNSIKLQNLN